MAVTPDAVVEAACVWLGTPYRHQASVVGAGCDCLGLLRGVWRSLYGDEPVTVPPYRADMRGDDEAGSLLSAAESLLVRMDVPDAGRVVIFRLSRNIAPRHCGILISPLRFIHAQEGLGVVEANLTESWRRRVAGVFAFP